MQPKVWLRQLRHIIYHSLNLCATPYFSLTLNQFLFLLLSDYFNKTINHKFTKRGVVYLFIRRLLLISSKGKSYLLVLLSLIFLLVITKWYSTYTLFTASRSKTKFLLYYKSLIKTESSERTHKRRQRTLVDEEAVGDFAFSQKECLLFRRG